MRVLYLAPQLPWPLDQGARIRNYYLLRALAAEHTVDLLCLDSGGAAAVDVAATPSGEEGWTSGPHDSPVDVDAAGMGKEGGTGGPPASPIAGLCRRLETFPAPRRDRTERLRTLVRSSLPDLAHRAWQPPLAARLGELLGTEAYDVLQISSLEMMPYRHLARRARSRPRIVFDDLNAEYQLQRRACLTDLTEPRRWHAATYSALQWRRLRTYEGRVCREADAVLAVSDTDAALLGELAPRGRFFVLPNGVDTTAFACRPAGNIGAALGSGEAAAPAAGPGTVGAGLEGADHAAGIELVFTGTMDYRPNVDAVLWFAETILPRLREAVPDVRCLAVGKAPDARLRAAAERRPGLIVTGGVPDVRPYLARAALYVVPMRMGSGVRLKVLEAMAAGVPVVSTRVGLEGIAAVDGEHALLADTPGAFAAAVLRLLADPTLGARLAGGARALVEQRYDWSRLTPTLFEVYRALGTGEPPSS
jgi:glycosyltransferase involved in cell wall biosynthesis